MGRWCHLNRIMRRESEWSKVTIGQHKTADQWSLNKVNSQACNITRTIVFRPLVHTIYKT